MTYPSNEAMEEIREMAVKAQREAYKRGYEDGQNMLRSEYVLENMIAQLKEKI
jgi:hypothetical protein